MNMPAQSGHPLTVRTKVVYGVGALVDSIKTFSFTTFLLFYYTTVLGLPGALLGAAMSIGLVWDASVDPLIGHLSDRTTARFGRRHSFMLAGAVLAGLSFIAVFNPPIGLSMGRLFAWLMLSSLCLRSTNSMFMVPYWALGAELAPDYHERTSISGYRAGAVLVGTVLVTTAAFLVFLRNGQSGAEAARFAAGSYRSMGVAFGIVMTIVGLIATLGTRHERSRLATGVSAPARGVTLLRSIADALRDRPFRVLVLSSALSVMASAINAALALHFLTYHARIEASEGLTSYFVAFYTGALAGVLVWVRATRAIEKSRAYALAMLATAIVMSAGYWLVGPGRPFGTGALGVIVVGNALAGFFGIAGAVIVPSMMADITARHEGETGSGREGIFFGVYSFGQQISGGLAVLTASLLVDRFAGLVPAQVTQSPATVERLVMISNVLPSALLVAAGLVALQYRVTRERAAERLPDELAVMAEGTQRT